MSEKIDARAVILNAGEKWGIEDPCKTFKAMVETPLENWKFSAQAECFYEEVSTLLLTKSVPGELVMVEKILQYLDKAEYFWRPEQIFRRFLLSKTPSEAKVNLYWGLDLKVKVADDTVGAVIWRSGIHDLVVSECLWRLIDASDSLVVDGGAHVGYTSSIMCSKVRGGEVWAFEPHPDLYKYISENFQSWRKTLGREVGNVYNFALSKEYGTSILFSGDFFQVNKGVSRIVSADEELTGNDQNRVSVETQSLDSLVPTPHSIGVLKLDVEKHELEVLQGAANLLTEKRIRDIVFEEHERYPSRSIEFLQSFGYEVFGVGRRLWGPVLSGPDKQVGLREAFESPTYLATADPMRAKRLMSPRGWQILSYRH